MFCDSLARTLNCDIGIYSLDGKLIGGVDVGFKYTDNIFKDGSFTYLKVENMIVCVNKDLSQDACNLIKLYYENIKYKEAVNISQPLQYILNEDINESKVLDKYLGYRVFYVRCHEDIREIIESIYEGERFEIAEDEDGFYIAKIVEDVEMEANSLISGIGEEKGIELLIGAGGIINRSYTIKDSAAHSKEAVCLAQRLGFKEGFYPIDKMIFYKIIESSDKGKIEKYIMGSVSSFNDILHDKELISTAEELFKCNLNISEAARRMYVHRNTLLYRVDKIKGITGLDIKNFEDAVIFKTVLSFCKLKLT